MLIILLMQGTAPNQGNLAEVIIQWCCISKFFDAHNDIFVGIETKDKGKLIFSLAETFYSVTKGSEIVELSDSVKICFFVFKFSETLDLSLCDTFDSFMYCPLVLTKP